MGGKRGITQLQSLLSRHRSRLDWASRQPPFPTEQSKAKSEANSLHSQILLEVSQLQTTESFLDITTFLASHPPSLLLRRAESSWDKARRQRTKGIPSCQLQQEMGIRQFGFKNTKASLPHQSFQFYKTAEPRALCSQVWFTNGRILKKNGIL